MLTGLPQLSACHHRVICTEHFMGSGLCGRWRENEPGTQGSEISGEKASLFFYFTRDFQSWGPGEEV